LLAKEGKKLLRMKQTEKTYAGRSDAKLYSEMLVNVLLAVCAAV
jgi:hypothetical protein